MSPPIGVELPQGPHNPPDSADDTPAVLSTRNVSAFDIIPTIASAAALADVDSGEDSGVLASSVAVGGPGGGIKDAEPPSGEYADVGPSIPSPPPTRDVLVAGEAWLYQKLAMTLVVPVAALVML
jgi:hypothetical protein